MPRIMFLGGYVHILTCQIITPRYLKSISQLISHVYMPAPPPPQVDKFDVYLRINKLKITKSTLPLDIPVKLRQECSPHLAAPLSSIINNCLAQSQYPKLWKQEWVTPAPKITNPKDISNLRKISGTSDYSKVFEGFIKDWIMEDVCANIDIGQFLWTAGPWHRAYGCLFFGQDFTVTGQLPR